MASIDAQILETLLHMSEGATLDFKGSQYPLDGATDEQKSEFVKDVLAFANAWKTSDAYILIGVSENPGHRASVNGVERHPDDASLQQLVNSKTNVPVEFAYIPATIDGNNVGVVIIAQSQQRPIFLRKRFGRLEPNQVYLRRGSTTDVASPDEIARMGAAQATMDLRPTVSVQLGEAVFRTVCGDSATICSHVLTAPPVPDSALSRLDSAVARLDPSEFLRRYSGPSREALDEYEKRVGLLTPLAFVVHNPGRVLIEDLRIIADVTKEVELTMTDEVPEKPRGSLNLHVPMMNLATGTMSTRVRDRGETWELSARLGKVQPNATVWSFEFWIGSTVPREVPLVARVYADGVALILTAHQRWRREAMSTMLSGRDTIWT